MVFARHIGRALVRICLILYIATPAEATSFEFPSCVDRCIVSSGCNTNSAKCMCRRANELLLDSVISCMYFNCKADLRNFEDSFLEPIEQGCERSDRDIPSSKIKAAESLASSYISKLTPLTTAKGSAAETSTAPPTLKPSTITPSSSATSKPASSSRTTEENTPSTTSTADKASETESASTAEETTAAPTLVLAPPSATLASTSRSPTSDSGSGFNTDPFGSSSSAGPLVQPFFSLLGLPLAVGVLVLALR
ncbi:hypothetical protein C8A03DRAFT_32492 [Achaetomium macrosporum]|uniref:Extracellular membrane protein CFEM domain-containing protein n=1 Tax=Achaetomium macrosporum TaxID=79813 RepID=A0AAN7CCE6_9PEZI|nr:hypothetical protein C8A03DRAFT_32492 [Achaetomium macrosporum]